MSEVVKHSADQVHILLPDIVMYTVERLDKLLKDNGISDQAKREAILNKGNPRPDKHGTFKMSRKGETPVNIAVTGKDIYIVNEGTDDIPEFHLIIEGASGTRDDRSIDGKVPPRNA